MPYKLTATQVAGKAENTEGSKQTLDANDCILVKNCVFSPTIEQYPRELLRGTLSRDPTSQETAGGDQLRHRDVRAR
jgi:hypothetical protein